MSEHSEKTKQEQGQADPAFILSKIRDGYKADITFDLGGYPCTCRILSAEDEAKAILKGHDLWEKLPEGSKVDLVKSIMVQKSVLEAGCQVGPIRYLPRDTLDKLSSDELSDAYDAYKSAVKTANPAYDNLTEEQINQIIVDVKKKKTNPSDYFTSDLAAIGRYFLGQLQRKANAPGG